MKLFHKIALSLAGLGIFTSILVSAISYIRYKQIIKSDACFMLQSLVERYGNELDNQTKEIENYSIILESILRQSFEMNKLKDKVSVDKYEQSLIPLLDTLAKKFRPLSYWIIFNPAYVKQGHTISFFDKYSSGIYKRESEYDINSFDLSKPEMRWWTDALKCGELWTDPYYWKNWDMTIISYSKSISINGKVIAVLGSDIDFKKFKKSIATKKIYKSGFLWILNDKFEPISLPSIAPKASDNLKNFIETNIWKGVKTGIIEYSHEKEKGMISYHRMNNGWYLCSFAPEDEIFFDLYCSLKTNMIIILSGILLSIGLAVIISRSLTKPVWQLVHVIRKGAKGDYSVRAKMDTSDELRELANYFNFFMDKLEITIRDLKINEANLISAKEKAEEADRLKSAFLANLSHEIRTPMNAIIGFTSLILSYDLDKETIKKYIDIVHLSTHNLLNMLNNLIDYSKLESKQIKIQKEKFDLHQLLDSIHAHYSSELSRIKKSHIQFQTIKEKDNELLLYGEKSSLDQVLSNLLSNSVKFTELGYIHFGYRTEKEKFTFFVEDSGPGIAKEELDNIFKSFYKGANTANFQHRGTGLGLAISKKLVSQMNGNIWINSEDGTGTTVEFTIPLQVIENE